MPLNAREFIEKRSKNNAEFMQHIMPQFDYLEKNIREVIRTLEGTEPKDTALIADFRRKAEAMHTVAHSHESVFNTEGSLTSALRELRTLPDFLEANNAANLRLINEAAKKNPAFKDGLHKDDQYKSVMENIADLHYFCDFQYGMRLSQRINTEMREELDSKVNNHDIVRYNDDVGKQVNYLYALCNAAAEELENQNFVNDKRVATFRQMADALKVIAQRGRLYVDEKVLESRLGILRTLPQMLSENGGLDLMMLRSVARKHPELRDFLSFEGVLERKKNLTLSEHVRDVLGYFNLHIDPELGDTLDREMSDERKEIARDNERRAENERLRRQEERDNEEKRLVAEIKKEEEQDKLEDAEERRIAKEAADQEKKRKADAVKAQQKLRKDSGSFMLPEGYDNRTAAGMFIESAKQRGNQYNALLRFKNRLGETITQWNEYTATEYAKRMAEVNANLPPENASDEQMVNAVTDAINEISPEELERQLREYHPNYDEILAAEKAKYPDGGNDLEIKRSLYERAMAQQLRDEERLQEYGADKIKDTQKEAALELAREKLNGSSQDVKDQFEAEKQARLSETIANQIKETIIKAYGQNPYYIRVFANRFPNEHLKQSFVNSHYGNLALRRATGEERDRLIFETMMGEFVDEALHDEDQWTEFNRNFSRSAGDVPPSLRDPEKKLGPLDVALKLAKQAPFEELTEKTMLGEIADTIPQDEIDRRAEEKLPLKKTDNQMLYKWARDRKEEQLKEQIRKDRDEKFPEVAKNGIQNLTEVYESAQKLTTICMNTIVGFEKPEDLKLDYEREVDRDQSLSGEDKRTLKSEYKNSLEEAKNQKDRELYPKLTTKNDEKLRTEIQRDAIRRTGLSPEELHAERLKALRQNRENDKKRRMFQKDWKKRTAALDQKNAERLDDVMNGRVKDSMIKAGDAVGVMFDKLHGMDLGTGNLGKALSKLDDEFTKGDLESGKKLCTKLGIAPMKKRAKPAPVRDDEAEPEKKPEKKPEKTALKKKEFKGVIINRKAKPKKEPFVFEAAYAIKKQREAEERRREKEMQDKLKAFNNRKNVLKSNINQLWTNAKTGENMTKEMIRNNLAMILATASILRSPQKIEDLTDEKISAKADEIKNGSAFGRLFSKTSPNYFDYETPSKMVSDFGKKEQYIASFKVPDNQQERLGSRLDPVIDIMEQTNSGKIIALVPRGPLGNSTEYKDALTAIKNYKENAGHLSAEDSYRSCITVLKYLNDKETVRKRAFGRKRWTQCMTFLKQAMPPEMFRNYCKTVNQARGVADNPLHEDYVSPESFGSTVHSEAVSEVLDQINRQGLGQKEDYAALLALKSMDPQQPVDKAQLAQKTQEIMQNLDFQYLVNNNKMINLHEQVVTNNNTDYESLAQNLRNPEGVVNINAGIGENNNH